MKRKYLLYLIGVSIFIIILFKIDLKELWQQIQSLQFVHLVVAVFLLIPIYFFKSLRWKTILNGFNIPYPLTQSILTFTSANFIAFITPGRIGEVAKAFYVSEDTGASFVKAFSGIIVDRVFDILALLVFSLIGSLVFLELYQFPFYFYLAVFVVILLSVSVIHVNVVQFFDQYLLKFSWYKKYLYRYVFVYISAVKLLSFKNMFLSGILTLLAYIVLFLLASQLGYSLGFTFNFKHYILFISITNILSFLPISIAGLGTREAAMIFLFSLFGLQPQSAVAFSMLIFAVFYIFGGLLGLVCFIMKPVSFQKLKYKQSKSNET
ncbi:MAG: lysylphosphatidylglycerol synthase transmembrane domain-containing protein [Bacteroidota bacterium]